MARSWVFNIQNLSFIPHVDFYLADRLPERLLSGSSDAFGVFPTLLYTPKSVYKLFTVYRLFLQLSLQDPGCSTSKVYLHSSGGLLSSKRPMETLHSGNSDAFRVFPTLRNTSNLVYKLLTA